MPAPDRPPLDFKLVFPKPQEIAEVEWIGNTFYYPVTWFALIFDGKENGKSCVRGQAEQRAADLRDRPAAEPAGRSPCGWMSGRCSRQGSGDRAGQHPAVRQASALILRKRSGRC